MFKIFLSVVYTGLVLFSAVQCFSEEAKKQAITDEEFNALTTVNNLSIKQMDAIHKKATKEDNQKILDVQNSSYQEVDIMLGAACRDTVFEMIGVGYNFYEAVVKLPGVFVVPSGKGLYIYKNGVLYNEKKISAERDYKKGSSLGRPVISPDGTKMLSFEGDTYGYIYLHDTQTGEFVEEIKTPKFVSAIEWHPSGNKVVYIGGEVMRDTTKRSDNLYEYDGKLRYCRDIYIYMI